MTTLQKLCPFCQQPHDRKGKFCSDACKQAAYRERKSNRNDRNVTVESAPVSSEASRQFEEMFQHFANDLMSYVETRLPAHINSAVQQAFTGLQITTFTGVQFAPAPPAPIKDEPIEIDIKKAAPNGSTVENFLKSVAAVAGVELQPVHHEKGIKKLDVPILQPPNFDDDDELPLLGEK